MKFFILFIVSGLSFTCTDKSQLDRNGMLAGMYKLYIIENNDSAGVWRQQEWAKDGAGYIIYDGKGHMGVHIIPKGYEDFRWLDEESSIDSEKISARIDSISTRELKNALKEFSSSYVYFGNYAVDDTVDVVTHYRVTSSIPAVWGTTVKRKFSFKGDTIILEPLNTNRRLKWIKQN
jgi:hypothetical protein